MTREEAIAVLENRLSHCRYVYDTAQFPDITYPGAKREIDAIKIAISALRPVSREQVERMKKEPVEGGYDELYAPTYKCPECGFENIGRGNFCQNCGCPYTDEAVEMVMEKLKKVIE